MIHWKTIAGIASAGVATVGLVGASVIGLTNTASAGPPRADDMYDMEASGFVMPPTGPVPEGAYMPGPGMGGASMAGMMMPPGMVQPSGVPAGGVAPAGYQSGPVSMNQYPAASSQVMPAGFFGGGGSSCDSVGCDSCGSSLGCQCGMGGMRGMGGYDTCGCGDNSCGGGCRLSNLCSGGILGKLTGRGTCEACGGGGCQGCGFGGGSQMSNMRHLCLFCRGGGCAACQTFSPAAFMAGLASLRPYSEQGKSAQRWYDLSAEALFLSRNGGNQALTSQGVGGPIVLDTGSISDDFEAGVRLSGALIFGVGSNLEMTYIGGHEFGGGGSVQSADPTLFSFVSDFGRIPAGQSAATAGFDDTDRSLSQSADLESHFHSFEANYRRRAVGPYGRFQGSWLGGFRYLRFDEGFNYQAFGTANNSTNASDRFANFDTDTKNDMYGAQLGFDVWYSVVPGVNLGMGLKGGVLKNEIQSRGLLAGNSLGRQLLPGPDTTFGNADDVIIAIPGVVALDNDRQDETALLLDFEFTALYRLTHSWTLRSSYQVMAVDDVAYAPTDLSNLNAAITASQASLSEANQVVTSSTLDPFGLETSSLVLQGISIGAEYAW